MEVFKRQSDFGPIITMVDGSKKFQIVYGGNFDLYWSIIDSSAKEGTNYEVFAITKENYYIYDAFDTLYNDIRTCNIYEEDDIFDSYKLPYLDGDMKQRNLEQLRRVQGKLFIDNAIVWYSDDGDYEYDEIVKISKVDDSFMVEFIKIDKVDKDEVHYLPYHHLGISVRFRNSGCRYEPFEMPFMKMYNRLCEYNPDYHQIHMEEQQFKKIVR